MLLSASELLFNPAWLQAHSARTEPYRLGPAKSKQEDLQQQKERKQKQEKASKKPWKSEQKQWKPAKAMKEQEKQTRSIGKASKSKQKARKRRWKQEKQAKSNGTASKSNGKASKSNEKASKAKVSSDEEGNNIPKKQTRKPKNAIFDHLRIKNDQAHLFSGNSGVLSDISDKEMKPKIRTLCLAIAAFHTKPGKTLTLSTDASTRLTSRLQGSCQPMSLHRPPWVGTASGTKP